MKYQTLGRYSLAIMVGAPLGTSLQADAGVIYNEAISGDAPPLEPTGSLTTLAGVSTTPNQNLGVVLGGQNIVIGTAWGGTVDNVDIFEFTVTAPWSVDLLAYDPGSGNS